MVRKLLLWGAFLFGACLGGCVSGCKHEHRTCPGYKREAIPEPPLIPPTNLPVAHRWVD